MQNEVRGARVKRSVAERNVERADQRVLKGSAMLMSFVSSTMGNNFQVSRSDGIGVQHGQAVDGQPNEA